ncbi:hypothetical protein AB5N19_02982 [Seiridium cardinale]
MDSIRPATFEKAPRLSEFPTKDYQDEAETRDSKFKSVWDNEMGNLKNKYIPYQKAFVLLLSWDEAIDDLKTDKEVTALDNLFTQKFKYGTIRKILIKDPRRSAQAQVNRHLAEFVDDHDDTNTLLVVYYAGHGRPGNVPGVLRLTGSTSWRTDIDSELHEIIWSSAEHNIKKTRADVLVIFDCCHAGELERNVRGHYTRRAFEFLAATSAKSTTRKPGKESFTSALIWSLSELVKQGSFSTQELLRSIQNDAPDFPQEQSPRLSERQPSSQRKIMFAPLTEEYVKQAKEASESDDEEDLNQEMRQDLLLRFGFGQEITEPMVKEIASNMQRLVHDRDIKAKTVSWEGINTQSNLQIKDAITAQGAIRYFSNMLYRMRNRPEVSPIQKDSPQGASNAVQDGVAQGPISPGAPSVDESLVATPDSSRYTAKPEIGDDQGDSVDKLPYLGPGSPSIPSFPHLKRRREIHDEKHDLSASGKRGKIDDD